MVSLATYMQQQQSVHCTLHVALALYECIAAVHSTSIVASS